MITRTPEEEAREARESLAKYGHEGTPAQVAAITLALDAGARVLFVTHPTLGGLSFLVYRPVPANVEDALNALANVPDQPRWDSPCTHYVTDNPNWGNVPYWDVCLWA